MRKENETKRVSGFLFQLFPLLSPRVLPSGALQRRTRPVGLDGPPPEPGQGTDPAADAPLPAAAAGRRGERDAAAGAGVCG